LIVRFFFAGKRRKEKAWQKETPKGSFASAEATRALPLDPASLWERLDRNLFIKFYCKEQARQSLLF